MGRGRNGFRRRLPQVQEAGAQLGIHMKNLIVNTVFRCDNKSIGNCDFQLLLPRNAAFLFWEIQSKKNGRNIFWDLKTGFPVQVRAGGREGRRLSACAMRKKLPQ